MKLKIIKIHGKGKQDEEYVELQVVEDCNLRHYMLADTTYTGESKISNKVRHVHWFSKQDVVKGDKIYLRTCSGTNKIKKNSDGTTTHTKYWGLNVPVWNNEGDAAILFLLGDWKTTKA